MLATERLITIALLVSCSGALAAQTQTPAPTPPVAQPAVPAAPPQQPAPSGGGQAPPATPTILQPASSRGPMGDSEVGASILLLDRVQTLLDKAVEEQSGKVTIDPAVSLTMRAEPRQVRMT